MFCLFHLWCIEIKIDSFEPKNNVQDLMLASCKYYEMALESTSNDEESAEIIRKLGSVRNELGLKYMYCAQGKK